MQFSLCEINAAIQRDPIAFMAQCDAGYQQSVTAAARQIAAGLQHSPIVLLSGPSGSGKTTTAGKIQATLETLGIRCHTISMDDYYHAMDPAERPRTETGELDYESPLCLDLELLNQHLSALEQGEDILVPKFDFCRQMRDTSQMRRIRPCTEEAIIFEGIHALNDMLTLRHPNATKVYISARTHIYHNNQEFFRSTWTRIMRRCVRDSRFRGTDAATTLQLWANVRRGEKLYISPYKHKANVVFDTSLAYEVPVLAGFAKPLFQALPDSTPRIAEIREMLQRFASFAPIAAKLVPQDSLLREFIGFE